MPAPDIDVRRIAWSGVAIAIAIALVIGTVLLLLRVWHVAPDADRLDLPYDRAIAGPRLQSAPQPELAGERARKEAMLGTSGWVDAPHGIVRIPIATAMQLLAGRPGPARPALPAIAPPPAPASAAASPMPAQRVGASLPLDSRWREADGRSVSLGDVFAGGQPVLVVFGYYTCPQLCGLLMHGLLEAVHAAGPRAEGARIVGLSIDPADTPATATARRDADLAYAAFLAGGDGRIAAPPDLHLLTADAATIDRVAAAAGYSLRRQADVSAESAAPYEHPAEVILATPHGRVAGTLGGVRFDAAELGTAIADARDERATTVSDRIALLCGHLGAALGRRSEAVLQATRAVAVLVTLGLAAWCWRRRKGARRGSTP